MKVAICDDNTVYLNEIEDFLHKVNVCKMDIDLFEKGEDLIKIYQSGNYYDAIFLDMEMNGLNGIETANEIRKLDKHVLIIFVTSYTKYMQKSFICSPFRFLVKPVTIEDIKIVSEEIYVKLKEKRNAFIFTENHDKIRLFYEDIIFFKSHSHWIYIHTKNKIYKIKQTMSELQSSINDESFSRTHKSFIVNLDYIKKVSDKDLTLYDSDTTVPISRLYKKSFTADFIAFNERKCLL